MDDIAGRTLDWLYKLLKDKRIALARAEAKGASGEELADLARKIDMVEWLIGKALEEV